MLCIGCRYLAESYSLMHATMAHRHEPCRQGSSVFYENNGITNGAEWYSINGGMTEPLCTNVL